MNKFTEHRHGTRKEGLEDSTARIIRLLQMRGKLPFKEIHSELTIDYRRAYDILNVLLTTPLVTKHGKKRENKLPYVFQDGVALNEPVSIDSISEELVACKKANAILSRRVARLEEELAKPYPDMELLLQDLMKDDPNLERDPLYKPFLL